MEWRKALRVDISIDDGLRIAEGLRFGLLTVTRLSSKKYSGGRAYECLCDCGASTLVRPIDLRKGSVVSCGCFHRSRVSGMAKSRLVDLSGYRFGRWTALEYRRRGEGVHVQKGWLCRCDCGVERWVQSASLKNGSSTSCGCSRTKTGGN